MSKIKRALSAFLAIAIVFGMFSCLAPLAAPVATAAGTSKIDSYESLVATYGTNTGDDGLVDGFIYIGTEYYEEDGNLTDYYVQPGDKLTVKQYVKSNMYTGENKLWTLYDNTFFDVMVVADGASTAASGYTSNYQQGIVNSDHPMMARNGSINILTSNPLAGTAWVTNYCEFDETYLANNDYVQTTTKSSTSASTIAYQMTSDEWILSYYVTVKEGLADGTVGIADSPVGLYPVSGTNAARRQIYIPCTHITAGSDTLTVTGCKTMASQITGGQLDYFLNEDMYHEFTIGEPAGGSTGGSTEGVSKIDSYESLVATYGTNTGDDGLVDGFIYIGTEYYEEDGKLTDYYVQPGDKLTVKQYVKSNMYTGENKLWTLYDNTFFDVMVVADGASTAASGYTSNYQQGIVNSDHPMMARNGSINILTSNPLAGTAWVTNYCEFDDTYLANNDYVQTTTKSSTSASTIAYQMTSDEWILSYYVTVKEGLADGTKGIADSPVGLYPVSGTNAARRQIYIPCTHITAGSDTLTVTGCKTMASQITGGQLDYFLNEDMYHEFTIGDAPAAGTYAATFTVDGETYETANYATGASIVAPETAPTKDGYTFAGWALEGTETVLTFPQTMGSAAVTYVAVFVEIAKHNAIFDANGGQFADGTTVTEEYAEGATIVAPADPSRTGYKFNGWNPTVGTMGTTDITFTAQWTANTYNVYYYKETTDTSAYQTLIATFDAAYNLPTAPTKTGYTFAKWVDADGADMPATHTVAGDVSYYATWTAGTFDATFNANGGQFDDGSATATVPTVFGQAIVAPDAPTRTGYEFSGWSPEVGNMTAEGMTFTAQWTAAQIGVHFMDGDVELELLTGDFGSDIAAMSPNPSKDGYTFKGWQYEDGTVADFPITLGAEAVYVYAIWEAKSNYIEFYDGINKDNFIDAGELHNQLTGAEFLAPEATTVSGYTFIGWFDADGNPMPETVPYVDGTQVYYAHYEATLYTATFYVDSTKAEVHDTYEGVYQSIIPAPETPVKTGYTFKYWSKDGSTSKVTFSSTAPKMPLNGINYVAQWTINSYNINYYVDDTLVKTETYTYGADVTPYTYTPAEGASFSGWGDQVPATMPANDVNVYGTTGTATYTVTFTIDSEVYQTIEVAYGAAITVPTVEDKEGYTFSGWDVPDTMPAGNQTYDATYTVNKYWVRFWLNDGKTNLYQEYELDYGTTITYPAAPEVAGKDFVDWDDTPVTVPAYDVDLVAMFNDIVYCVEFYNEDGEIIDEYEKLYGETVDAIEAPAKEGYDFVGWFVNGVQATFPYTITEDTAFELVYDVQSLKVIYYVDGAQYDSDKYEFGAAITLRDNLVQEGYTFSGWKDADGNDAVLPETMPAEDIIVYGSWTVNQYPVTFNAGEGTFAGGSKEITIDVDYGTIPAAPETPTLAGYGFKAWTPALAPVGVNGATYTATYAAGMVNYTVETYTMDVNGAYGEPVVETKSDETDETVSVTPVIEEGFTLDTDASVLEGVVAADGSTTLKVYIIRNQYDLTISIDGVDTTKTYYYGADVDEQADPTKEGYEFLGWSEDIPATMPAEDKTITANFKVLQFTITFVDTGDVAYEAITKDYGTDVGEIADPVKTGYTFTGWDKDIPATIPAENVTITAQWTINKYTITFAETGDSVIDPITQDYATAVTAPADPEKEGHKFLGWDVDVPETMPAGDMTITATWEVLYYDATFVIDGESTVISTAFGTIPEAPKPTKVGYTFTGWEEGEVVAMVVGGATYTAVFTANTYEAIFDAAGGAWADGATTKIVPTVFDTAIETPLVVDEEISPDGNPVREAYIFAGWAPEVGNMTTEGITFVAQWTNDTSYCRVQNVELINPTTLTNVTKAAYEITVMESPVKIQIAGGEDYTFTWTYDRLDEKIAGDLTDIGLVAIVKYDADGNVIADDDTTTPVATEKWTIVAMLSEGDYKVRAKVGYTTADWEEITTAYDYSVEFEDIAAVSTMIQKVTPAVNTIQRGETSTITVVADAAVTRLRLIMNKEDGTSLIVSYSPAATSSVTITENADGTKTWVLSMRFTYTGTAESEDQKWVVWYRTAGVSSWLETDKYAEVKVTKYEQTSSPSETYPAFSIVSVTPPTDAVAGEYSPVVIVTTSDVTKVRLGFNGKTSTYIDGSNNCVRVDNGDGTATWTINYRFSKIGEQTWTAQCRGNKWSTATEFTFTTV